MFLLTTHNLFSFVRLKPKVSENIFPKPTSAAVTTKQDMKRSDSVPRVRMALPPTPRPTTPAPTKITASRPAAEPPVDYNYRSNSLSSGSRMSSSSGGKSSKKKIRRSRTESLSGSYSSSSTVVHHYDGCQIM